MTSESQERMLAIVDAREPRRGARAVRTLGDPRDGRRSGHRHRPVPRLRRPLRRGRRAGREPDAAAGRRAAPRSRRTARPMADVPVEQPRRRPASTTGPLARAGRSGRRVEAADPAPELARRVPRRRRPRPASCSRCSATPTIADKSLGVAPVRPPALPEHGRRPRRRRSRAPAQGHRPRRSRSPPTARRASAGSTRASAAGSPCSRRRATSPASGAAPDGAGELPELRQPRAPRGDVAVLRGRRRAWARRARRSASRSSAAT